MSSGKGKKRGYGNNSKYGRERLEYLRSSVDIQSLLSAYGAEFFVNNESYCRTNCIVHGGRNKSSLHYDKKSGRFVCFGQCGFKGDIFDLVMAIKRCSFKEAVDEVERFSLDGFDNGVERSILLGGFGEGNQILSTMSEVYKEKDDEPYQKIYSPLVERALASKYNPYVESGKFLPETMEYFEVGYCDFNDYFMNRAIITIHDEFGNLVGYSGRNMSNNSQTNKYRIKKGFKKGKVLYNLHRAKEHITYRQPMVITEGFGQTWRLWEAGVKTPVALMGKEATEEQLTLILKYATSVVLALDFDDPGLEATAKLIKELEDYVDLKVVVSRFNKDIDLADMSVENAMECYNNAIPAYLWYSKVYRKS